MIDNFIRERLKDAVCPPSYDSSQQIELIDRFANAGEASLGLSQSSYGGTIETAGIVKAERDPASNKEAPPTEVNSLA